jgi:hypothetical protein
MKSALRMRYWCSFCKKSGARRHAMELHEKRCTMNPERECGMCKLEKLRGVYSLADLRTIAQNSDLEALRQVYDDEEGTTTLAVSDKEILDRMEYEGDCPVCIFAALRQTGRLAGTGNFQSNTGYDFKKRVEEFWRDRAADEERREMESHYY